MIRFVVDEHPKSCGKCPFIYFDCPLSHKWTKAEDCCLFVTPEELAEERKCEDESLSEQMTQTQLALCDVYEMMV